MERKYYDADSLGNGLRELERTFGLSSAEFIRRHIADDETLDVPRFERHVWASLYEDVQRLAGPVMDRVSQSFAVPA